jgi:hypothetical protein
MAEDVYCCTRVFNCNRDAYSTDFLSVLGDGKTLLFSQSGSNLVEMWDTDCDKTTHPYVTSITTPDHYRHDISTVGLSVLADGVTIAWADAAKGILLWRC